MIWPNLHHILAGRHRTFTGEKVKRNSRKPPPEGWTEEALDRYFFGSQLEAASHLANNVFKAYLDPEANNPLSPLPPKRQPRVSFTPKSRLFSETDPRFLDFRKMGEDRCTRCHRYKKNAPTSDVSHVGSKGESQCKLDHYPAPCDFIDDDGTLCDHSSEKQPSETGLDSADDLHKREMEDRLSQQALQMEKLQCDLAEMRRLMLTNRPPAPSQGSLAPTTTTTSTSHTVTSTQSITSPITSFPAVESLISLGAAGGFTPGGDNRDLLADMNALLQKNVQTEERSSNLGGYNGPSMKDLQRDKGIADEVQRQMNLLISGNPALQKVVAGQTQLQPSQGRKQNQTLPTNPTGSVAADATGGSHLAYQAIQEGSLTSGGRVAAGFSDQQPNLLDMDSLLGLTVREKQYRPHEFASRGNFYYAKNINVRNITLPLYVFGYLKHCVILQSGLVPVAEGELMARLVNLMNICEIASNNSTLNDFDHAAWQMARAYGDRVFNDMEHGLRSWSELPNHVLPDVFLHARDLVDVQSKRKQEKGEGSRGRGRGRGGRGSSIGGKQSTRPGSEGEKLVCTSYNDFYTGNGCAYEYSGNKKCGFEHYCSKCFAANGTKEGHKGRFCSGTSEAPTTTSG